MITYLQLNQDNNEFSEGFGRKKVINLQAFEYESLTEMLLSLGYSVSGTNIIRELFHQDHIEEIIKHNRNCLKNKAIILIKRFINMYKI